MPQHTPAPATITLLPPSAARHAALNAPIRDALREDVHSAIWQAASHTCAAQAELGMGSAGRVGHLAAHVEDALQALLRAREVLQTAGAGELSGVDLAAFGWRSAALEGEASEAA